ncbi:MAG: copper chaperone PCu(A)C [Rhodothermales bacterium]
MRFQIVLLLMISLLSGCERGDPTQDLGSADVRVVDAWVRAMPGGAANRTAAYLTIINPTNDALNLTAVTTEVASTVELHETTVENDVMRMRQVDVINVPAGGQMELSPGGHHVMLLDVRQRLVEGDSVSLLLDFQERPSITVRAPVREP